MQLAVKFSVECLGVQNAFPRFVQRVKTVHFFGLDEAIKREFGEDVQMRAVRCAQVDVLDERDFL